MAFQIIHITVWIRVEGGTHVHVPHAARCSDRVGKRVLPCGFIKESRCDTPRVPRLPEVENVAEVASLDPVWLRLSAVSALCLTSLLCGGFPRGQVLSFARWSVGFIRTWQKGMSSQRLLEDNDFGSTRLGSGKCTRQLLPQKDSDKKAQPLFPLYHTD